MASSSSPSDRTVSARAVLRALAEYRRHGSRRAMAALERAEPDLAEFVLEGLSGAYHELLRLGGTPKATRRAYRRVQELALVAVAALRHGHDELWQQEIRAEPRLAVLADPPAVNNSDSDSGGGDEEDPSASPPP